MVPLVSSRENALPLSILTWMKAKSGACGIFMQVLGRMVLGFAVELSASHSVTEIREVWLL